MTNSKYQQVSVKYFFRFEKTMSKTRKKLYEALKNNDKKQTKINLSIFG